MVLSFNSHLVFFSGFKFIQQAIFSFILLYYGGITILMFEFGGRGNLVIILNVNYVVAKATDDSTATLAKIKSAGVLAFKLKFFFCSVFV